MAEIRILNTNDLDDYTSLLSSNSHTYSWDKLYLEHVTHDCLNYILSPETDYWNIFGSFKDNELVACVTLRQLKQVGSQHKAMIENLFLKDKEEEDSVRDLIREVIEFAKSRVVEKLVTSVTSNNISGKIFFSSLGFETLGLETKSTKIGDEYFDVHWLQHDMV